MNSFRTETFNISNPGRTESFLLQGGQRWQSITLLTNSSLTINDVGFRATVNIQPIGSLTGAFSASDPNYASVWNLGARSVQAACVETNSQPSTWQITQDGALVPGQYPAQSVLGDGMGNYTLSFSTKVVRGGTGWKVASAMSTSYGPYFVLTSNGQVYENTDLSIVPQNKLIAGYGFTLVNQTILPSAPIRQYSLPMSISDNEWYRVTTVINSTGYLVSVNDQEVAFVDSAFIVPYITGWATTALTDGTWAFGPYLDQEAYYKDVEVIAQNGSVVYTNAMTSEEVYKEYAIATNDRPVCLDGAKRDRVIWFGDFTHTARELATSTGAYYFIQNMIELAFEWQFLSGPAEGLVAIQPFMGAGSQYKDAYYPAQFGETDYEHFFLVILGDYFRLTSDTTLLSKHWAGTKLLVQTLIDRYLDPVSGLLAAPDASWFTAQGTQNATAPTALFAVGLNQLVDVANALNDSATASSYAALSENLSSEINSQLWSNDLGAYSLSLTELQYTSALATAFTIRAGIANASQATSSIENLSDLFYLIGYKDSTGVPNGSGTQLSPNVQGFLLESLFLAHSKLNVSANVIVPVVKNMLDVYWPVMVNQNQYFTGAPWEYVYPDGSPGIGIFTSLCHPWGGAPTYVLSDYVLGVRREMDETTGTFQWVFDPIWGIVEGLGLDWAKGRVPLFDGGYIEAEWKYDNGTTMDEKNPQMTVTVKENNKVHVIVKNKSGEM